MALYRILVVDDSPAVRETVGILLGHDYEVHAARIADFLAAGPPDPRPDLIIADRTVAATALPSDVRVLWIDDAAPSGDGSTSLSRRFSPRELRRRVAQLLQAPPAPAPPRPGNPRLRPPFLPAAAAQSVTHALGTDLPLHLWGEPGTGKRSLARAVHTARGSGSFLAIPAAHFDPAVLDTEAPAGGTLFIDRIEQLDPVGQQALLAALAPTGLVHTAGGGVLRLITAAVGELEEAVEANRFAPALFYRITVLSARLPALRERPDEIPELVRQLAAELGPLLGRPQVSFTPAALERLSHYLWFGNLAELEAVLARTIALSAGPTIDAGELLFHGGSTGAPPATRAASDGPSSAGARRTPPALGDGRSLDLIINELAHEFKNPLVTIKTFAHHLRRALPRGGDDEKVAKLTGEAVQQIDQTLENLLEFTRMDPPVAQSVPLGAVLNPVFAECGRALAARGAALDHGAIPRVAVRGDPQQVAYAFTNLLRALTRDLNADARLTVRYAEPATISIVLPEDAAPLGSHLATLLDRPPEGAPAIPLGVAIANAVLERNGAQIAVAEGAPSTIIVRFPVADDEAVVAGNGTSPRIGR